MSAELILAAAVVTYPIFGAIVSGLFKRLIGNTDAGVFLGWPFIVGVAPFLLFGWGCSKLYEFCAGERDEKPAP